MAREANGSTCGSGVLTEPEREDLDYGASRRAIRIARAIDRACRTPGRFVIVLDIPAHRRSAWRIEIARIEALAHLEARRDEPG